MKHTKGEWKLFKHNYTHAATINIDINTRICAIEAGNNHAKEWYANAKLIASAPELLKALIEIVEKLDNPHIQEYLYSQIDGGFLKAKEVIKKATS